MSPESLIYSPHLASSEAIAAVARRRGLSPISVTRMGEGLRMLHSRRFAAVILDCSDQDIASDLVHVCRSSRSNKSSIVLAVTSRELAGGFWGSNLIVKCSPDFRELGAVLRTAEGMILQEFRRYRRLPVWVSVVLENDEHRLCVQTANISEGGMCVSAELPGWNRDHSVEFDARKTDLKLRCTSQVVWRRNGKSGIQFRFNTPRSRNLLAEWLQRKELECA